MIIMKCTICYGDTNAQGICTCDFDSDESI